MLKNSPFVLEFASLQFQTFQTFNDCAGDCLAPLHKNILNSALSTCEEGSRPNLVCTARCAESYYPVPATLDCQGHRGKDGMNSARSTSWWGTLKANCLSLSLPCLTMPWWLVLQWLSRWAQTQLYEVATDNQQHYSWLKATIHTPPCVLAWHRITTSSREVPMFWWSYYGGGVVRNHSNFVHSVL